MDGRFSMSLNPGIIFSTNTKGLGDFQHVVFLGIYNAERFVAKIGDWLPNLRFGDSVLVIADNVSNDNSLEMVSELAQQTRVPYAVIRNARNYGGYGTLAVNLEYFQDAKWVTTLHQDDSYRPNHLDAHREILNNAPENLGMIASEAVSIDLRGRSVPYPRASWLLDPGADPVTIFLAHLKQHVFPFSGATFAKQALLDFPIPWHSSAFPDTELVMKMVADYSLTFAPGITVEYLENPQSESHYLSDSHRDLGAFQALIRTFAHPNYAKICKAVRPGSQGMFLAALKEGIQVRIHDPQLRKILIHTSLEMSSEHFGMSPQIVDRLVEVYADAQDYRAVEVLANVDDGGQGFDLENPRVGIRHTRRASRGFLLTPLGLLPRQLRVFLAKFLMSSRLGKRILKSWNFEWETR